MTDQKQNRFISNNLSTLQEGNQNPLSDYEDAPVRTLEEVAEELSQIVPNVVKDASTAKKNCHRDSNILTWDESAAIRLYTMQTSFSTCLNQTLRSDNQRVRKEWFPFLKLIESALKKLPPTKATVWRGVNNDDAALTFINGQVYTWWSITSCTTNIKIAEQFYDKIGILFTIETVSGRNISAYSANDDEQEVVLMPGTRVRVKSQSSKCTDHLFIIHLEEIVPQGAPTSESNNPFESIKRKYRQNSRIQRFMNPSKSFPIEESYINLAIVTTKEQHAKENQLRHAQQPTDVLGTFEQIYGTKTTIDVKNIFETCKNQRNQVLVFGRAGIGKSTFCQYITHRWATGSYWSQYDLLVLLPLRSLTVDRYPSNKSYSLLDLAKQEVFFDLTAKEEELLCKRFDLEKTLWILDGYDEIAQNVPPHLQCLFEQLLRTPHHILTSRPYLNTLSYDVQMEITGFTNENITQYVKQFFEQMKHELNDGRIKSQRLLKLLEPNKSIWGIAHIPLLLELICSLWSNEDWSETENFTITRLYALMLEWLCRRYARTHDNQIQQLSKNEIHQHCQKELTFLESLAFKAMKSNMIIIPSSIINETLDNLNVSSREHPHILNMGVLKSVNKHGTGSLLQRDKDHYFIHLSFQEYFSARYLVNALKGSQPEKAIEFIKYQKYNQRFTLVFTFAAGLLNENDNDSYCNIFWDHLLGEPLDLVGIRHLQLVIFCLEETNTKSTFTRRAELLQYIAQCIHNSFIIREETVERYLSKSLQRAQSVACDPNIINKLIASLKPTVENTQIAALNFILETMISNLPIPLLISVNNTLDDRNEEVRRSACSTLGKMGEKAATNEVITKLVSALGDQSDRVRMSACEALGKMGEKAVTNEVITKLLSALGDQSDSVSMSACEALGKMGEKAATNEVITKLLSALGDQSDSVRSSAYEALGKMGEKAATNEVITKLVSALGDQSDRVRSSAYVALGMMGEKAATDEAITMLVSALGDQSDRVRMGACFVLENMGEKAATDEVITKLVSALGDQSDLVRWIACKAFGKMGEKAATKEVITKLVSALGDQSYSVRWSACEVLGDMGKKAATNEVITKLVSAALGDQSEYVRMSACEALGKMGEKAATNEVITKLVSALGDQRDSVRMNARFALGKMGEKAATDEVITKLLSALDDQSEYVRQNACFVLGNMGEKAAKKEVITKLVSLLGDRSEYFRMSACSALGKMGEKAATNEVITKLVSALGDPSDSLSMSACFVLGKMGEKAVTNEVITKLVSALGDQSDDVRSSACFTLGKIGKKAATNEVITKLVSALRDQSDDVRQTACEALGKMGEKAATKEVITKLVSALGDQSDSVSMSACFVLGKMGEKAVTNEVITKLAAKINANNFFDNLILEGTIRNILSSPTVTMQLSPETIADVCFGKYASDFLRNISEEDLISVYLTSKNLSWLTPLIQLAFLRGTAVTVSEDKILLYSMREPIEVPLSDSVLRERLLDAFLEQRKRLHLSLR